MNRLITLLAAAGIGIGLPILFFAVVFLASAASAHDIYSKLLAPNGSLCCGGDPVTGDCEGLSADQIEWGDGSVTITSKRYGGLRVLVPMSEIQWARVPGDGGVWSGHWCGKPREGLQDENPRKRQVDAANPDPVTWTYCTFIAPGDV